MVVKHRKSSGGAFDRTSRFLVSDMMDNRRSHSRASYYE